MPQTLLEILFSPSWFSYFRNIFVCPGAKGVISDLVGLQQISFDLWQATKKITEFGVCYKIV